MSISFGRVGTSCRSLRLTAFFNNSRTCSKSEMISKVPTSGLNDLLVSQSDSGVWKPKEALSNFKTVVMSHEKD